MPRIPKLSCIILLISLTISCEDFSNTQVVAGTALLALLLNQDTSSDSSHPHQTCYGMDNNNCDPGLSNDAIWEINIKQLTMSGAQRELGNLSDFDHFLILNAQHQTWDSYFFIKMPGTEQFLREHRFGTLTFSGENLQFVQLNTLGNSCENDYSLIELYNENNFQWEISRYKKDFITLRDPNLNIHERSEAILDNINYSSFTSIMTGFLIFPVVFIVEMFVYMFTPEFWLSLIEGEFYYKDYLLEQYALYFDQSTEACFSAQGMETIFTDVLNEQTADDLKFVICEDYIEGFENNFYENNEILEDCEDFIEEQIIEDICGHLSGIEKDICIAAL